MEEGYVVLEIKTITSMEPEDFDQQVNAQIREGWLLKSLSVMPVSNKIVFAASMVKEAIVPVEQPTE